MLVYSQQQEKGNALSVESSIVQRANTAWAAIVGCITTKIKWQAKSVKGVRKSASWWMRLTKA